jgi:hypothetical protein
MYQNGKKWCTRLGKQARGKAGSSIWVGIVAGKAKRNARFKA